MSPLLIDVVIEFPPLPADVGDGLFFIEADPSASRVREDERRSRRVWRWRTACRRELIASSHRSMSRSCRCARKSRDEKGKKNKCGREGWRGKMMRMRRIAKRTGTMSERGTAEGLWGVDVSGEGERHIRGEVSREK